jgi:serine/threonine-protein kinase HipA
MSREIYVSADWEEFDEPMFVGTLRSYLVKAKEHFSFAYDEAWLQFEKR